MKRKVYLIQPTYRDRDGRLLKGRSLFTHSLAMPALSAAIPPGWEKEFCLEYFEDVNYETDASVIGVSSMGYDVFHGREIAEQFRARGKVVLFGGYQAQLTSSLVVPACDSLIHGNPGPRQMARILADAEAGRLAPEYRCGVHIGFPFDYSVLAGRRIGVLPVLASIGCRNRCEFCCTAALYGGRYYLRPLDAVVADLRAVRRRSRYALFVDSNVYNNREYLVRLCSRMAEERLGLWWAGQSTIDVADDPEALALLRRAGCRMLAIGLESVSQESLDGVGKTTVAERYMRQVQRLREAGIAVGAFFMLGLDGDDKSTAKRLADFIHVSRIALPILNLLLPAPGTRTYERLKEEGRLLMEREEDALRNSLFYNGPCNRCFFTPRRMSTAEAEDSLLELYRRLCRVPEILWRSAVPDPFMAVRLLLLNLDLRREMRGIQAARAERR